LVIDGRGFAPQLLGKPDGWPRDWIFVELGAHWYDRDIAWKLNEAAELYDMRGAPFTEIPVPADKQDDTAATARKRLQAILDQLNPAGGKTDPGDGTGKHANRAEKKAKKSKATPAPSTNSQNANEPGE
jgi:hypothetical protein